MRIPNWRSLRADWRRLIRDLGVLKGVRAWTDKTGTTCVEVDLVHPHLRLSGRPRYRFTTTRQFLDPAGFPDPGLRGNVADDANKQRRRALFCLDLRTDLTLAALSFHVDRHPSVPLIVTDIALREDEHRALGLSQSRCCSTCCRTSRSPVRAEPTTRSGSSPTVPRAPMPRRRLACGRARRPTSSTRPDAISATGAPARRASRQLGLSLLVLRKACAAYRPDRRPVSHG